LHNFATGLLFSHMHNYPNTIKNKISVHVANV